MSDVLSDQDQEKQSVPAAGPISIIPVDPDEVLENELKKRAKALGIPLLSTLPKVIDREVLKLIPEEAAQKYRMASYEKEETTLRVAMADPEGFEALNILRFVSEKEQMDIDIVLASERVINDLLRRYTGTDRALEEAILS